MTDPDPTDGDDLRSEVVAVVVAAGDGVRFGGTRPKALLELGGRPLVAWAVAGLLAGEARRVAVVAPTAYVGEVEALLAADDEVRGLTGADVRVDVVAGGRDRQASVRHGLDALGPEASSEAVVLVHDAARPLAPVEVATRVAAAVRAGATAVTPVVPVTDTVRQLSGPGTSALVDRDRLRAVQTPQGFCFSALYEAHQLALRTGVDVTDDVAACELAHHRVVLVDGSPLAFKITLPLDLHLAEALLAHRGGL